MNFVLKKAGTRLETGTQFFWQVVENLLQIDSMNFEHQQTYFSIAGWLSECFALLKIAGCCAGYDLLEQQTLNYHNADFER